MQAASTIETVSEAARRTQAHDRALRHSARVRLLRRAIPLLAGVAFLGIGGLLMQTWFAPGLPNVEIGSIGVSGSKVTMEHPRLSGFRKGEHGYEVTAAAALQDVRKPSLIELKAMKGHLATDESGGRAHLEADGGLFDSTKESLRLDESIRLWTDKGEEIRLKSAAIDFKAGSMSSSDPVTVTVPTGTLTADSLEVVENGKVISFVGRVRAEFRGQDAKVAATPERVRTSAADPHDGPDNAR